MSNICVFVHFEISMIYLADLFITADLDILDYSWKWCIYLCAKNA